MRAGNGLQADLHEFQLTPQGTALITAYDPIHCDLAERRRPGRRRRDRRALPGDRRAHGARDVPVDEPRPRRARRILRARERQRAAFPFDYFHINSINLDQDGSLLISSRNTWTAYDLDPQTGQIDWQLGGRHSSFALGAGSRRPPGSTIRASSPTGRSASSTTAPRRPCTASRAASSSASNPQAQDRDARQPVHAHAADLAESQGNIQALPNGDWFVGWGQVPDFSELSPTGALLFDAHFPPATSPTATCASPGAATPRPGRRSRWRRAGAAAARVRGPSTRAGTGPRSSRVAGARGRHRAQPQAGRAGPSERLRDGDRLARGNRREYVTVQALGATGTGARHRRDRRGAGPLSSDLPGDRGRRRCRSSASARSRICARGASLRARCSTSPGEPGAAGRVGVVDRVSCSLSLASRVVGLRFPLARRASCGSVNQTSLPLGDGIVPQEVESSSTMRRPRPTCSCGVGDRGRRLALPLSLTSTRISSRESRIASSKSVWACRTQLVASSEVISSAARRSRAAGRCRRSRTNRRAAVTDRAGREIGARRSWFDRAARRRGR